MQTEHRILRADARELALHEEVELVLTSPPYPLIEQWDADFAAMSPAAGAALAAGEAAAAFEAMHQELDRVWAACHRALVPGGLCCVNIGDAARRLGGGFALWPNHARVLMAALRLGFTVLPDLLWHKPTNAPNRFLGSGMLPAGAYVTYEHEYVLVLRKGGPRRFDEAGRRRRQESAFFWEERNAWFSDLWSGLHGERQAGVDGRTGAFPVELAFRLVLMHSLQGDRVLDPFAGTGTTALAAAMAGRHSLGLEWSADRVQAARARLLEAPARGRARQAERRAQHERFLAERARRGRPAPAHHNEELETPVITAQERRLRLLVPLAARPTPEGARVEHGPLPPAAPVEAPHAAR